MHPLRQHTGICNSWGGAAGGAATPLLCLTFLCFPSLWRGVDFFFLLPATKGSEAGGGRDPRARDPPRSRGDAVSGRGRTERGAPGSVRVERGWSRRADPGSGSGSHRSPLGDPHFLIGFQRGAGPGGLSPAALVTGMEPCECICAPPGCCQGVTASPHLHPSGFIPGVRLARQGAAGGAFLPPLPAVPAAEQGPDIP